MIDLKTLEKAKQHPPIIVLHGHEGIGKSTAANQFQNALWCNLENSTYDFDPYMPLTPQTYSEIIELLQALIEQKHDYKTLIIDTIDKLETMMTSYICAKNNWRAITEPAYGKGYGDRSAEFLNFWNLITTLNTQKNMVIVIIAHSQVVKVEDPILPAYDKHTLQLYKTENQFIRREADLVGYCMIETFTSNDGTRNLATTAGERQIRVWPNPAYDAKTRRANMPEILPMSAKAILDCYRIPKKTTPKKEETKGDEE